MRLCGISTCFQMLSPCIRQVTHALLTRPPLRYQHFHSQQADRFKNGIPVRLACVKHAASVHPEPGSNSRNILISDQNKLGFFQSSLLSSWFVCFLNNSLESAASRLTHGNFFRVALLFICQGATSHSYKKYQRATFI